MMKVIKDSQVWRGGAGMSGVPRTSPFKRQREPADTYMPNAYEAWVDGPLNQSEIGGITLTGMVNTGRGQSDVCLSIPLIGFATILLAMMKSDADATWAAIRIAATTPTANEGDRA